MVAELLIRGRRITPDVLCQINSVIENCWDRGRTAISRELCLAWNWRQDNGALKDQVCRILLRRLEDKKLVFLPPPKRGVSNHPNRRYYVPPDQPPEHPCSPMEGAAKEYCPLEMLMVRRTEHEALWNYLVYRYHYKSYRIIVGPHLKHIVFWQDKPIACLAWGPSVFQIESRNEYIGWNQKDRSRNIRHIANNNRFLILPWVRVKNLASRILAMSARYVARDWQTFYGYPVYLLETYVDRSRFAGTCYKAANWQHVGQTKGYAKKENRFYRHGQIKDVFVYPLVHDFRAKLANQTQGGDI